MLSSYAYEKITLYILTKFYYVLSYIQTFQSEIDVRHDKTFIKLQHELFFRRNMKAYLSIMKYIVQEPEEALIRGETLGKIC